MTIRKKAVLVFFVIALFGSYSVYANGQGESANLTGTITNIQPSSTSGSVNVVLSSQGATYTVTLNQSVVTQASLQVGQNISLAGILHRTIDGANDIQAATFQVNGVTYTVDHFESATAQKERSSGDTTHEAEAPEPAHVDKPDAGSGHDS